jgi:hypothetical protein
MRSVLHAALAAAVLSCAFTTAAFATGAIAVNDAQGMAAEEAGYGLGYGGSKREASANAVQECKAAGNDSCEVVLTYEQCGAYIGNKAYYATGVGATEAAAQRAAKQECPECKLIVADCH